MRIIASTSIILCLMLGGCAGTVTELENDLGSLYVLVQKDLPGWETAVGVLWSKFDSAAQGITTVLSSQAFQAFLELNGVSSSTVSSIESYIGVVKGYVTVSTTDLSAIASLFPAKAK